MENYYPRGVDNISLTGINENEVGFSDFVLRFANLLSDGKKPDEFYLPPCILAEIGRAFTELVRIENMSIEEAEKYAKECFMGAKLFYEDEKNRVGAKKKRLEEMLVRVMAWSPPTPHHQTLKEDVIKQLRNNIETFCSLDIRRPYLKSGVEYKREALKLARERFMDSIEKYKRVAELTNVRHEWARVLRQNLREVECSEG